jgi:Chaperone of endosialidase
MKLFKQIIIAAALTSAAFSSQAQVKIGANPTVIGTGENLEVEATNGNKVVILQSNGYVGIGTATPTATLDVVSWSGVRSVAQHPLGLGNGFYTTTSINLNSADGNQTALYKGYFPTGKTGDGFALYTGANDNTNASKVFSIGEGGRGYFAGGVGIGISTPSQALDVVGNQVLSGALFTGGGLEVGQQATGDRPSYIDFHASGIPGALDYSARLVRDPGVDGNITLHNTGTGSINIFSGSNVGIGTGTPTEKLTVVGNILATGTITPSDVRFKENIVTLNGSLSKINQLRGVSYTHKAQFIKERSLKEGNQIGFIAQELEALFPEFVVTSSDGYKAVDYARLTPVLVEALKEVNAKLEAQQAEINELKALVKQLLEKK